MISINHSHKTSGPGIVHHIKVQNTRPHCVISVANTYLLNILLMLHFACLFLFFMHFLAKMLYKQLLDEVTSVVENILEQCNQVHIVLLKSCHACFAMIWSYTVRSGENIRGRS